MVIDFRDSLTKFLDFHAAGLDENVDVVLV